MGKIVNTRNYKFEGIEKIFAHWECNYKIKRKFSIDYNKNNIKPSQNIFIETLSFLGDSVSFFRSLFLVNNFSEREKKIDIKFNFTHILLNIIISFQKNWNQELLQNLDFFQTIITRSSVKIKEHLKKDDWVKLISLINIPSLYGIGVDIKSVQNKILNAQNGSIYLEKVNSNQDKNVILNAVYNSVKINFFMDYGRYLKMLFTKKDFSKISTKKNFSKVCFDHFLLSKAKNSKPKKLNLAIKKIHLIFLKDKPRNQKFTLFELLFIKRKLF